MGEKISARVTAKSEMGYWHVIKSFSEKGFRNWPTSPKCVDNSVRGTAKSEMGYRHAKWGEKNLRGGQLNHIIKILEEKGV